MAHDERPEYINKLIKAIKENNILEVAKILNSTMDIHYGGELLLFESLDFGRYEIIELLLEYGANINHIDEDNYTPLISICNEFCHCSKNDIYIMELLLKNGANPALGNTRVITNFCLRNDRTDILELLCEYGFKLEQEYLLSVAFRHKYTNIIEFLINKCPDFMKNKLFSIQSHDMHMYNFIKMLISKDIIDIPN